MRTRACKTCNTEKPLGEFYAHPRGADGIQPHCKECHKANMRRNRRKKIDYYREYDIRRYHESPGRQAKVLAWYKRKIENSPAMRKAANMVSNAIRDGRLLRQPCEVCGDPRSEAHHCDYLKPFDVMWLCRSHHIQWHHDNGPGLNAEAPADAVDREAA